MRHPARLPDCAWSGIQTVFLTICTHGRRALFVDHRIVSLVVVGFLQCCRVEQFDVLAYCFMPDHMHALLRGTGATGRAVGLFRAVKQLTGYQFKQAYGSQLWQRSFFDRTLRADEDLRAAIAYLVANPVRARLVASPAEYRFWGSETYSREEILEFVRCADGKRP